MSVSTNYVTVDDNSDYRAENIPRANNPNNPGSPRRYRGRRHQGYRNHIGRSTQCDRQASDHQNSHTAPPTLEELERIASTVVQNRLIPDSQKFHAVNMRAEEIPSGNIDNICSDCIDFMAKLIPEPELVVAAPASDGTTNKNSEDVRQTITLTDQHRHQLVENFLRSLELQASDVCHLDSFISESCGEIRNNIISALPANVVVDIAQMCRRPDLMKKSFGSDVYASLLSKGMIIDYGNPSTEKDWWSPLLKYTDETHGEMMIRNVPDGCENCHCFLRDIDRKYQTRTSKNITDFISNKCSLGSYQGLQDPDGHSEKIDGLHGDEINCKASPSSTTTNVDWAVYESKSASEESEGGPVSDSDEEEGNTSSGTKDESKESGDEARTESGVKKEDDNLSTASTIPFIEINDERKETIIEREGSTIKDDNLSVEDNDRKDKSQYMTLFDTGNNRWKSLSKYGQAVTCLSICKHVNGCPIRKINAERFRSAVDVKFNEVNRQSSDHAIPEDAMDVQLSWRLEMKPKHILAFSSNADMLSATLTASSSITNIDNVYSLLVEEQLPANLSLVIADGITRPSVTSRLCIHTVISVSMQVPESEGAFQSENGMKFFKNLA